MSFVDFVPAKYDTRARQRRLVILDVFWSILSQWRRVLLATAVGVVIGLALALLLPTEYSAVARVLPRPPEQSASNLLADGPAGALLGLSGGGGFSSALGLKNPADLYIGLLKSRIVADKLIAAFQLQSVYRQRYVSQTRKKLASRSVFEVEKEGLITISVTDRDPARAAAMANAYVTALHGENSLLATSQARQRRLFFEEQLNEEKQALADSEVDLRKTEETTGLVQLTGQTQILLQRIAQVRAQITSHEVQLESLHSAETDQNPEYQRTKSELDALQSQLERLLVSSPAAEAGSTKDVPSGSLPSLGLAYVRKLREVKYHQTLFELLARQYAAARMDQERNTPQVQVVDVAETPDRKSWPPRTLLVIAFGLLGLLVGTAIVVGRDILDQAATDEQVASRLDRIRGFWGRRSRP